MRESDFVVIACPLNSETFHLVDEPRLALMRPTSFLINVARGPIVDQRALVAALAEGRIAGAGLDVFEQEPVDPNDAIIGARNVIAAPHSLGYTDDLLRSCIRGACAAILDVACGRIPPHLVNPDVRESSPFRRKLRALAAGPAD
jgi:D-3-phosphoglycerate dehydrogenase